MSGNGSCASMSLRRGNLYFDAALHERYFRKLETVILLRDAEDLLIMPVAHAAAGGYLIKLRNSAGDRVIDAADFFRRNSADNAASPAAAMDDTLETRFEPRWSSRRAALIAEGFFANCK